MQQWRLHNGILHLHLGLHTSGRYHGRYMGGLGMKIWTLKLLMPDGTTQEKRVGSNSYQNIVDSLAKRMPDAVILDLKEE